MHWIDIPEWEYADRLVEHIGKWKPTVCNTSLDAYGRPQIVIEWTTEGEDRPGLKYHETSRNRYYYRAATPAQEATAESYDRQEDREQELRGGI